MGLFNFSNVPWIYMTVFALFERTDYIEYGNSVRVDVTSVTQDLDSVYVEFESSWYMRGLSSLIFLMVGNLLGVLAVDHFVNRRWWRLMSRNSLGRQHMFNSTSILSDMGLEYEDRSFNSITSIKARMLCSFQWFFTSHLICFGLPEEPSLIRKVTSARLAGAKGTSPSVINVAASKAVADGPKTDNATDVETHMVVQDEDGHVYLFDSEKREVKALGVEVKILRDANYQIG
ncbi:hypothetical protein AeNC1_007122 [Aphanomyces euteiches]|nr:hypothetical protein AeNC1_007122 [Aphanomyces euteiches]